MKIKISDLQLNTGQIDGVPSNPRTITEKDFEDLKESLTRNPDNIKKFPLVIAEHKKQLVVISGNQRLRAMQALGWTELEHVGEIYPDGTDPEILREAVIIANTHTGEWDWDMLANEWDETELEDWGLDTTQEWDNKKELPETIDDIPEPPKDPITKLGDLWLLGNHRVLCGDSTDKTTVELLMDGKKADMVFTDPPYGMNLDTDYSGMKGWHQGKKYEKVIGDNADFEPSLIATIFDNFPAKETFIFGCDYFIDLLPNYGKNGSWFVWDKRVDESKDKMFGSGFEMLWSQCRHQRRLLRGMWAGFMGDAEASNRQHPTQKPSKIIVEILEEYSQSQHVIADPFLGSGSTLIACEQTGRNCYGLELDPQYTDVICKRWQTLTGQMPILESTGEAHDFIDVQ